MSIAAGISGRALKCAARAVDGPHSTDRSAWLGWIRQRGTKQEGPAYAGPRCYGAPGGSNPGTGKRRSTEPARASWPALDEVDEQRVDALRVRQDLACERAGLVVVGKQ